MEKNLVDGKSISNLIEVLVNSDENSLNVTNNYNKAIYSYDFIQKKYTFFSKEVKALIGYNIDELNEVGFANIVHKVLQPKYSHLNKNENPNKNELVEDFSAQYQIKTKGGEIKWLEDVSILAEDTKGERKYSIGFLRDITEIQNHVEELKNEKNKLNEVLDLANILFMVIDSDNIIRLINQNGCKVLGYEKVELINSSIEKIFSKQEIKQATSRNKKSSLKINATEFENISEVFTKNKIKKTIKWNNKIVKNEDGSIKFMISSGEEITERIKEERVQQIISNILDKSNSEVNINDLFSFIHQSISELMPVNNFYIALNDKENNFIYFPYFVDEVDTDAPPQKLAKGLTEYVLRYGTSALIDKKNNDELVKKGEIEIIGTPAKIWLGTPLKIQDKTIGVLVVQDYENEAAYGEKEKEILEFISYPISRAIERKIVEEEKSVLIERLKELNESKDKLFSIISHDLRSPFNSLLGFSEILDTEFNTLTHEEVKQYLKVIYDTSKNLFGMTNNLLHYSRFQMGKIDFKPSILNLRKVINNALKLLNGNLIKKNITVNHNIDKTINVVADEELLNSVIQNIISNSIKFTEKSGEISISAMVTKFFDKPNDVEVIIKDTGIGMSKKDIDNVYNNVMFTTQGTEREYGTGLGLLLVKQFVEQLGGNIKIQSKANSGTTFTFTLPVHSKNIL